MREEEKALEGAQAGQHELQIEMSIDPFKAAPVYVSAVSVGKKLDHPMVFLSFFAGSSIAITPKESRTYSTLIASFALEPNHARFLYEHLKDFLKALGEEV